jgi:hypothetical protein
MSVVHSLVLIASLISQAPATPGQAVPDAAAAEAVTKSLFAAFGSMDAAAMKDHFAATVRFIGDPQFLGESRGPQVSRELTRDQLMAAYSKMFSTMDPERWRPLVKLLKPSLTRAVAAGGHPEDTNGLLPGDFVKPGEYLFELRAPGSGLDDVILFVLRPVDGRWKVIAHWADY